MSCTDASVNQGPKGQIDGAGLADRKVSEVPVIFLEGKLISRLEARSQVRQFIATQNLAGLEQSLAAALRKRRVSTCSLAIWMVKHVVIRPICWKVRT